MNASLKSSNGNNGGKNWLPSAFGRIPEEETTKGYSNWSKVMASQDSATQWIFKRMKSERAPEFKKKGHEKQLHFIEEVKNRLETPSELLSKVKLDDDKQVVMVELGQGMDVLLARQKLIRFADRSDLGWQVVDAYKSDELASDDEVAKRLEKAERIAEQKAKKRQKKGALKARSRAVWRGSQKQEKVPHGWSCVPLGLYLNHWCQSWMSSICDGLQITRM